MVPEPPGQVEASEGRSEQLGCRKPRGPSERHELIRRSAVRLGTQDSGAHSGPREPSGGEVAPPPPGEVSSDAEHRDTPERPQPEHVAAELAAAVERRVGHIAYIAGTVAGLQRAAAFQVAQPK